MLRTRPPSRCPGSSVRSGKAEAPEKALLRLPRKTRKQDHRKMEAAATLHGPWRVYMNSSYNGTTKRPPYHPPHILISLLPCCQHETSKLPAVPPVPPVLSGENNTPGTVPMQPPLAPSAVMVSCSHPLPTPGLLPSLIPTSSLGVWAAKANRLRAGPGQRATFPSNRHSAA